MNKPDLLPRRQFLQAGLLGSAALVSLRLGDAAVAGPAKAGGDPFHGLKVGLTSYTLRKFKLEEAIAMTKAVGVKYISLKDVHLPLNSTTEERKEAARKVADAGLVMMGCGVVYIKNDAEEVRKVFEYAKDAGMPTIICSPDPEALDLIEKAARDYDIRIAIHNHGPGDKRYPSPLDVWRMVKDRDSRVGICMDVGHTVRIGEDPVEVMQKCAPRLYDFHMKDVTLALPEGKSTEVGKGVIDVAAVLKAMVKTNWQYHVALEYEAHEDAPMPGVIESIAFMRGVLAAV